MNALNHAIDRFCARHPRFGIPDLMRYIVLGNIAVYLLANFSSRSAISFLQFNLNALLRGEVWRLVTFVFVPMHTGLIVFAVSLYFYYMIGTTLEREWGTAKFTLYYISGVVLTLLATVIASLISGYAYPIAGTYFVNLSMFFAFAMLYPNAQVLLFFIIPVKMKWLAWLDAALFAYTILTAILAVNLPQILLPIIALLNFFVFFAPNFFSFAHRTQYRHSAKTVNFHKAVKEQERAAKEQGYHHKCEVCGRTDTDYPDLEFRYCSKCAGYHCFCEDHINNHVHFTK